MLPVSCSYFIEVVENTRKIKFIKLLRHTLLHRNLMNLQQYMECIVPIISKRLYKSMSLMRGGKIVISVTNAFLRCQPVETVSFGF